jgi:WD40 repeat protein
MMEHGQDVKSLAWHPHEEVSQDPVVLSYHSGSRSFIIYHHLSSSLHPVDLGRANPQILASASYDSHIHLMYDDPDSDWLCFQKLHAKLPQAPINLPSSSSSDLVSALFPTQEESEADASIDLPPLEEDETVWSLAWAPGGEYLASGGDDGGIRLWTRQ